MNVRIVKVNGDSPGYFFTPQLPDYSVPDWEKIKPLDIQEQLKGLFEKFTDKKLTVSVTENMYSDWFDEKYFDVTI